MTTKTSDRHWFKNARFLMYICVLVSSLTFGQALAHEDYSSSREEVAGKLIRLGTLPLKTYTHYLTKLASDTSSYNFTVETDESMDGVFIGIAEFKENKTYKYMPPICDVYNIMMIYPNGEILPICKDSIYGNKFYQEWIGFGRITVAIEFLHPNSSKASESTINVIQGPQGREIPNSALGSIVFTLYKDCSNNHNFDGIELRSCAKSNDEKCIASDLFCDGDPNCFSYFESGNTTSYDDSKDICTDRASWKRGTAWSVAVPIAIGFGVISVVVALVTTLKRMIEKRKASGIPWKLFA